MRYLLIITLMYSSLPNLGQDQVFVNDRGVALNGYDVVAYRQQHAALRGSADFSAEFQGATYYFNSAENLKSFKQDPAGYLPAFGGYCAFAMAMKGETVPSDPRTFKFHDGKLYLFFNDYYQGKPFNTIIPWNQDERELVDKAQANWNN